MTTAQLLVIALALLVLLLIVVRRRQGRRLLEGTVWMAPAELAVVVVVIGLAVAGLAGSAIPAGAVAVALAAGVLWLGRGVLRDYVLGVANRVSRRVEVGDTVAIEGHEGIVAEVGRLGVALDDPRGRVLVPHGVVAQAIVHRRNDDPRTVPHRFEYEWSAPRSHHDVAATARRAALLSPWAAAGRDIKIEPLGPRRAAITVYAAAGPHGFEIERAIRDALQPPGEEPAAPAISLPPPPRLGVDGGE